MDAPPASPTPRIVVVDRSTFFREAVRDALNAAGHRCSGVVDLADLAARDGEDVALWLLDLATTGAAGIEAWRAARAARPALQAIVLSDPEHQERVLEALRAGAADYLARPLHEEELRLSVARALAVWQAETERAALRARVDALPTEPDAEADLALARDLCRAVTAHGDGERVLDDLVRILGERLGADSVSLYLPDRSDAGFLRERQWEAARVQDRGRLAGGRGLTGAAVATGEGVVVSRPAGDPRFDPEVDTPAPGGALRSAEARALVCLPLRFRDRTVGLVRAFLPAGAEPGRRAAEIAGAALSAALRSVLLYRSWRSGVDELARARREAALRGAGPGWVLRDPGAE